ncbi:hypothetical protein [Fusobacterium sp. SYSU M8D902]|uniref:hypothetical protein n=1 Tax=Fusobacterium sp. SYSU M8D902 TaxID=3159562 RepID=UPI0032E4E5BB
MKRVISLVFLVMLISSCSSYTPKSAEARYNKLSNKMDKLMDDVIVEKKRAELEKDFTKFNKGMVEYKKKNADEDVDYLDNYIKKTNIKIQYLRDLRD